MDGWDLARFGAALAMAIGGPLLTLFGGRAFDLGVAVLAVAGVLYLWSIKLHFDRIEGKPSLWFGLGILRAREATMVPTNQTTTVPPDQRATVRTDQARPGGRQSRWERASWIATVIGTFTVAVTTAVATIIAVVELFHVQDLIEETRENSRVAMTLNFDARYKSDPLLKYALQLGKAGPEIWSKSPQERIDFFFKQENLQQAAWMLADFYDDLYICADRKLCDINLTLLLLSRDIASFYITTHNYLDKFDQDNHGHLSCGITALYKPANDRLWALKDGAPVGDPELPRDACQKL